MVFEMFNCVPIDGVSMTHHVSLSVYQMCAMNLSVLVFVVFVSDAD